ncbi:MAG: MFS transporter [Chloroflexota bacterium]
MAASALDLRTHRDFLKLWAGETVSLFGSQVTLLALPLTAILLLDASPLQMGLLRAASTLPFLLVGLAAGVWVDRARRRPILIGADLGRALLLAAIPVAAFAGLLRIELLYLVGFAVGLLTVFFDVAYLAYLPVLVHREQLVEGNAKLEISRSVAQIGGPGLAGGLVQLMGAAAAVVFDAASYLASAACLWGIRAEEPPPTTDGQRGIWAELWEGLATIVESPVLRSIAACTALMNLFGSAAQAVFVLFLVRDLGIASGVTGLVMAALGPGALVGALTAQRVAARFGVGRTLGASIVGSLVPALLIAGADGPPSVVLPILALALFLQGLLGTVYNVTQVSLRQTLVPDRLQGRMNATMRFVVWGTLPIGSLAGGALGEAVGLRPVLAVGVIGVALASLVVTRPPVRRIRGDADDDADAAS